jgi:hypothetical protein
MRYARGPVSAMKAAMAGQPVDGKAVNDAVRKRLGS